MSDIMEDSDTLELTRYTASGLIVAEIRTTGHLAECDVEVPRRAYRVIWEARTDADHATVIHTAGLLAPYGDDDEPHTLSEAIKLVGAYLEGIQA